MSRMTGYSAGNVDIRIRPLQSCTVPTDLPTRQRHGHGTAAALVAITRDIVSYHMPVNPISWLPSGTYKITFHMGTADISVEAAQEPCLITSIITLPIDWVWRKL